MVQIVNSLFADYLTPATTKEQQTTIQPIAQRTYQDPILQPNDPLLQQAPQPVMVTEQQPVMTEQTQEEEEEETTTDIYDFSTLDLDALANLDLSGLEGLNLELDISNMYMPKPTDFGSFFNEYSDFLSSVASGNTSSKVNRNDDIYNNFISSKGDLFFEGTPEELRGSVGLSDAFAVYDNPESQVTSESVQAAYQALIGAASPQEALSQYYGFEFQPAVNEGANYTNAAKYGVDQQTMSEFHSLVEPILQKAIPYIQATQGLNYTDALEYAYLHDPMVNALYQSYGVDLYRQTKDGSTYIFDPIAGQEIRTLEVKDPKFKDIAPALAGIALSFAGIPAALGTALGASGTAATALGSAIMSGATTLVQGGDLEDALKGAITSAITAGVSGGLEEAVAKTLGVSKDVAAGITAAGLSAAQGGNTEDALLSGFLAGASSYIQGELPSGAEWDAEKGALVGKDGQVIGQQPDFVVGGADSAAGSAAAWSQVLDSISNVDTQAGTATETPEIFAGRTTGEATADTTVDTSGGGMLTAETPAGAVEEVVVTPSNDVLYTVPTADGAIIQTAEGLLPNEEGERWFKIIQEQDPAFYEEMVSAIEQYGTDLGFKWKGIPLNVSDWFGGTTTSQAPERIVEPTQGDTAVEQITPEDAIQPEQPPLPPADETLDIPEVDIENLPPEVDVTPVVTPPTPPETPQVPTNVTGGGGGGAPAGGGASGGVGVPQVPTIPTDAGGAQGDAPEVADVFGDTTLEGDAFGDTVTGGADGGAAAEGGDAGTVDVTTTEQYQNLQAELDNALASQSTLEIEVDNLQNEVDAANAALAEAEAAAESARASGAANAEALEGEVAAAQATADNLQGQLNSANEALGNANSTIEGLQGQLTGTQNQLNTALANVESLTGQLTEATNNANSLSTQLSTAQDELASLQSEYEAAQDANADTVDELAKEISDKEGEISDLESELTGANATIDDLEAALAESQSATEAAIAEGIAAAEAAGEAGYGEGYGTGSGAGVGAGTGLGSLLGLLSGFGLAQGQQPTTPYKPTEAEEFMAQLDFKLPTAEILKQKQVQDYVGMLLGNRV